MNTKNLIEDQVTISQVEKTFTELWQNMHENWKIVWILWKNVKQVHINTCSVKTVAKIKRKGRITWSINGGYMSYKNVWMIKNPNTIYWKKWRKIIFFQKWKRSNNLNLTNKNCVLSDSRKNNMLCATSFQ